MFECGSFSWTKSAFGIRRDKNWLEAAAWRWHFPHFLCHQIQRGFSAYEVNFVLHFFFGRERKKQNVIIPQSSQLFRRTPVSIYIIIKKKYIKLFRRSGFHWPFFVRSSEEVTEVWEVQTDKVFSTLRFLIYLSELGFLTGSSCSLLWLGLILPNICFLLMFLAFSCRITHDWVSLCVTLLKRLCVFFFLTW